MKHHDWNTVRRTGQADMHTMPVTGRKAAMAYHGQSTATPEMAHCDTYILNPFLWLVFMIIRTDSTVRNRNK